MMSLYPCMMDRLESSIRNLNPGLSRSYIYLMKKLKVCMLIFPEVTLQDFVGPYEVFNKAGCFELLIVSEHAGIIPAEGGLELKVHVTFEQCQSCDILFVPGGRGITPLLKRDAYLSFIRKLGSSAQYISSVCTGSLLLAAAGLLHEYKATTHWRSLELLHMLGVDAVEERVVIDRNRITGGGITSGIDFALVLTALIGGDTLAKRVQLMLEYHPEPPFNSGSPRTAEPHIVQQVTDGSQALFDLRKKIIIELQSKS
jgi:cyclohexyl-isocyanide hydratase